eukprot:12224061-Prorocentrum_lima.AAC.1
MARWHHNCPRELQAYEHLVLTVNKQKSSAVAEAKLAELKRWQYLNCFRRSPRSESKNRVDGTWVLKWKK